MNDSVGRWLEVPFPVVLTPDISAPNAGLKAIIAQAIVRWRSDAAVNAIAMQRAQSVQHVGADYSATLAHFIPLTVLVV